MVESRCWKVPVVGKVPAAEQWRFRCAVDENRMQRHFPLCLWGVYYIIISESNALPKKIKGTILKDN